MNPPVSVRWRLRILGAVAVIPPLLELLPLSRLAWLLARASRLEARDPLDDGATAHMVDGILRRSRGPWAFTCLRRAVVLYFLLRKAGRSADLCIGVRRDEHDEIRAHAWLLLDGDLYLEPVATHDLVAAFSPIARFPSQP